MTRGIYELKFSDGCIYIGQSINIEKRFATHKRTLENNTHHNKFVQEKFNKLGLPAITILEECTTDNIYLQEIHYTELVPKDLLLNINEPGQVPTILSGELNGRSKYSNDEVVDVLIALSSSDISKKELAEISPVSYSTIRQIASGTTHKWLKEAYPVEHALMLSKIKKKVLHKIKDPSGMVHEIVSQRGFVTTHDISLSSLNRLIKGRASSVNGWILIE